MCQHAMYRQQRLLCACRLAPHVYSLQESFLGSGTWAYATLCTRDRVAAGPMPSPVCVQAWGRAVHRIPAARALTPPAACGVLLLICCWDGGGYSADVVAVCPWFCAQALHTSASLCRRCFLSLCFDPQSGCMCDPNRAQGTCVLTSIVDQALTAAGWHVYSSCGGGLGACCAKCLLRMAAGSVAGPAAPPAGQLFACAHSCAWCEGQASGWGCQPCTSCWQSLQAGCAFKAERGCSCMGLLAVRDILVAAASSWPTCSAHCCCTRGCMCCSHAVAELLRPPRGCSTRRHVAPAQPA
jgi:hypothetical protein